MFSVEGRDGGEDKGVARVEVAGNAPDVFCNTGAVDSSTVGIVKFCGGGSDTSEASTVCREGLSGRITFFSDSEVVATPGASPESKSGTSPSSISVSEKSNPQESCAASTHPASNACAENFGEKEPDKVFMSINRLQSALHVWASAGKGSICPAVMASYEKRPNAEVFAS